MFGLNITFTNNHEEKKRSQILMQNENEDLTIYGFKSSTGKTLITYVLYVLTLGTLRLLFHWFPSWRLHSTHSRCTLSNAEKILIVDKFRDKHKNYFVEDVQVLRSNSISGTVPGKQLIAYVDNGDVIESPHLRIIVCKTQSYVWHKESNEFIKLCGIDRHRKCIEFHKFTGYTASDQAIRQITYGKNKIEVPYKSVLALLVLEALTPFYVFQVFSLCVWFTEGYFYYTIAIIIMSVFGIAFSVIQTRKNQHNLHMSVHSSDTVVVCRGNGVLEEISSCDLVPGDVIEIPESGGTMQCDAVLLSGTCIVNESMLTGESVPITKTAIPNTNSTYDVKGDSFHTLFSGTDIVQTHCVGQEQIFAVVLRTGYLTTKGELVRSILYPPPSDFKFDRDSYMYILILFVIAIAGCIYTIILKSHRSIAPSDVALKTMTLFTIVIPPALPAAMTVGKLYALSRLKKLNIFCMNSRVINVSGSINCVCFDKTGTLTEDSLDMWGVVPVVDGAFCNPVRDVISLPQHSFIVKGMATCHSLSVIKGQLLGDPLDVKVFESTGWRLETTNYVQSSSKEQSGNDEKIVMEICRQFQFVSSLQRMSVITKHAGSYHVYCKGSPEMIVTKCNPDSVPNNLHHKLKEYTSKGYRVIALATKSLEGSINFNEVERTTVEEGLKFVALIVLENCLKPETTGVIQELNSARMKTIMITGDNIETAISVAKECNILHPNEMVVDVRVTRIENGGFTLSFVVNDSCLYVLENCSHRKDLNLEDGLSAKYQLTMNGTNWALIREQFPNELSTIILHAAVFARMSGTQKQELVQELQKMGYYVAMCGDGANDCGALKAAHVGISLSEEDSSVASPFTSKTTNISCVPIIIKEGRAALTTSFGVFKYMICYSLIQFASSLMLYSIDSTLTILQFLFIDICLTLQFMMLFGKTEACKGPLHKMRPPISLLSFIPVLSLILQLILMVSFQALAYYLIQTYDWFKPFQFDPSNSDYYSCYENFAVFAVSVFQYITLAVCFSKGKPFRKPVYTNKPFLLSLIVTTFVCVYIIIYPAEWVISLFEFVMPGKLNVRFIFVGLALLNFLLSILVEDGLVERVINMKVLPKVKTLYNNSKGAVWDKQTLQLPFDITYRSRSMRSITFENNKRIEIKKEDYVYTNFAFVNDEI